MLTAIAISLLATGFPGIEESMRRESDREFEWMKAGICSCQTTSIGVLCERRVFSATIEEGRLQSTLLRQSAELLRQFPSVRVRATISDRDEDLALLPQVVSGLEAAGFPRASIVTQRAREQNMPRDAFFRLLSPQAGEVSLTLEGDVVLYRLRDGRDPLQDYLEAVKDPRRCSAPPSLKAK